MTPEDPSKINPSLDFPLARLTENLNSVRDKIATACSLSGRQTQAVTLVAVTKNVPAEVCNALVSLGCHDLAENRPQVLWEKTSHVPEKNNDCLRWHFIGHLQRNKSARTLPLLSTLHSLDSLRLAEQIAKDLSSNSTSPAPAGSIPENLPNNSTSHGNGKKLRVLLEVNVTSDTSKTGLLPTDAIEVLKRYASNPEWHNRWDLCGLMGMSSLDGTSDLRRSQFASLRSLRDLWQNEFGLNLPELSMGMSDDFQVAIEEGSTMVRIGSLLYR
jgi:pyridoxal phosphate enzyme (YggS family)